MMVEQSLERSPRVSVLMTIFNAGPYLKEAIDSVVAQTFGDWELIAIENGSSDESPAILASYEDERIRAFVLPDNIGRTSALRRGFDQAQGDYIAVLDADDVSHPARLQRQVAFLDSHPDVVLVGSWFQYIDEVGDVLNTSEPPTNTDELHDSLGRGNPFAHSSVMYRQKAAHLVGNYPAELKYAQDFGLILALAQRGKLAVIDDCLCKLRVLSVGMTRSKAYRLIVAREEGELLRYAAKSLPLSAKARRLNRRAVAISDIKCGIATMFDRSILAGVRIIACALVYNPTVLWMNPKIRKFRAAIMGRTEQDITATNAAKRNV